MLSGSSVAGPPQESEDSTKLNTAFCERSNLTTRRACAYLARKTPAHARNQECLEENLHLVQFHYNFVRPHRGLRFGTELRTPAMQAGLTARALTFREVFLQWEPVSHASTRIVSMSAERGRTLESAA